MKTKSQSEYKSDHTLAKVITCAIVIGLLIQDNFYINIFAVVVWFFAPNPIGHIIETFKHHRHRHGWF